MDYRTLAENALAERRRLFEKRKALFDDPKMGNDAKRAAASVLDSEMDHLAEEARRFVDEGEREQEIRGAYARAGGAMGDATRSTNPEDEWRGGLLPSRTDMAESRAENGSEYLVPAGTAAKYVDVLRAKAIFLKGIPAENLIPFNERDWTMPILSDTDMPTLVQENALITEGDDTWVELEFNSKAYKDIRGASNELFDDSALNLRKALADTLLRNVAVQFDADAFSGAGGTADPLLGLVGQGVSTPAAATGTATFDDIALGIERLWTANAEPSVIWLAPDAAGALSREREGTEGAYLAGEDSAVGLARSLPQLVSTNVPAGTVVVADGSRVFAGIRQNAKVAVSEHAEFANDRTLVRLTMRAAGVYVVESSSVQVITKTA